MVNYRVFDDNGELISNKVSETVILEETFTIDEGSYDRSHFIPHDSSGTYANRLHVFCKEEGDYGIVHDHLVGLVTDTAGAITLYGSDYATDDTYGPNLISLDVLDFIFKVGVENTAYTTCGYLKDSSTASIVTVDQACLHRVAFRTKKMAYSIPIKVNTATTSTMLLFSTIQGADNKEVKYIWTIED